MYNMYHPFDPVGYRSGDMKRHHNVLSPMYCTCCLAGLIRSAQASLDIPWLLRLSTLHKLLAPHDTLLHASCRKFGTSILQVPPQ